MDVNTNFMNYHFSIIRRHSHCKWAYSAISILKGYAHYQIPERAAQGDHVYSKGYLWGAPNHTIPFLLAFVKIENEIKQQKGGWVSNVFNSTYLPNCKTTYDLIQHLNEKVHLQHLSGCTSELPCSPSDLLVWQRKNLIRIKKCRQKRDSRLSPRHMITSSGLI